jgi:exopolysaccharide production protein ExoQ
VTAAQGSVYTDAQPQISWRLVNFCISLVIFLIFSQAWVFPLLGDKGDPSTSGLVRNLFFPAYGLGIILLATSVTQSTLAALRQPFLLALMVVIGASIFWSVSPDQTERRVVAIFATTLCSIVIVSQRTWAEISELFATAFALLVILCFAFAILIPSIGVMHELFPGAWRGVWSEKNQLGDNMSMGFCIFLASAVLRPKRWWLWLGFAGLAAVLILMSQSKTSLVAAFLGLSALTFVIIIRRGPIIATVFTWMAVVVLGSVVGLVLFAPDFFFSLLGKDATFTGRTKIWEPILRQIAERPWTGYGYGAVWTDMDRWAPLAKITKQAGFRAQHAHNAWLEQWLGLGLVGLSAFVLMQIQFLISAIVAAYRGIGAILALPFFICYTLMCVTESVAVLYNDFRWVMFTAIAVKLAWPDWRATDDPERLKFGSA